MDYFCSYCLRTFFRDGRQNLKPFLTKTGKYKSYCDHVGRMSYCKKVVDERRGLGLVTGALTFYKFADGTSRVVKDKEAACASHC